MFQKQCKKVKECIAIYGNSITQLRSVTCRMGSHSVTCHPTQANTPDDGVMFRDELIRNH